MKNRFRSKAPPEGMAAAVRQRSMPPGRRANVRRMYPVILLLLLPAAVHAQEAFAKPTVLPAWHVQLWEKVVHPEFGYFGWYSTPLGDINGDGYDDFAVSALTDTTFIFLGGDPFDHTPTYIVRGGSSGIASGDFNRDGRMDLVTAIDNRGSPGEYPPERRGAIRIYLQKDSIVPFTWEPDLLIEGEVNELVGKTINQIRGSLCVLDYNGDGWLDIVTKAVDVRDSVRWKCVLYLGGPAMDTQYDAEFRVGIPQWINHTYVEDVLTSDINGDGCDDVMIQGMSPGPINYWDLFLGNPWAIAREPQRVLRSDIGWSPQGFIANVMDIDGDGYADIFDAGPESLHRPLGDALLFHGRTDLPLIIRPDDSIPNLNPDSLYDLSPQIACPVGDMNGDGSPDLVMAWNPALCPGCSPYYFYPGGPEFRVPLGYFGTDPNQDFVVAGVFPAGDVNGDGYDDILTMGKGYKYGILTNRFQIWLGAPQLKTGVPEDDRPASFALSLSPNPIAREVGTLNVRATGLGPGRCTLEVTDMLGRTRRRMDLEPTQSTLSHTLHLTGLSAGTYLVTLRQGIRSVERKLIMY
ncbi:MAG: T9SS type A sorting domain-containing protein [Bacteroidetes bacterium]|nr:T9SS type A sorting domain-containing protein [Bacteroidota bacterium]